MKIARHEGTQLIPALRRLRQQDFWQFKESLDYIARLVLKLFLNKKKTKLQPRSKQSVCVVSDLLEGVFQDS